MSIELTPADMERLAEADQVYFGEVKRLQLDRAAAKLRDEKHLAKMITAFFDKSCDTLLGKHIELEQDLALTEAELDARVEKDELQEIDEAANDWVAECVEDNVANGYFPPPHSARAYWKLNYCEALDAWADAVKTEEVNEQAEASRSEFRIVE